MRLSLNSLFAAAIRASFAARDVFCCSLGLQRAEVVCDGKMGFAEGVAKPESTVLRFCTSASLGPSGRLGELRVALECGLRVALGEVVEQIARKSSSGSTAICQTKSLVRDVCR